MRRGVGTTSTTHRDVVTLPSIRSLFPDLLTVPPRCRPPTHASGKLRSSHFGSGMTGESRSHPLPSKRPLSDAPRDESMPRLWSQQCSRSPMPQVTTESLPTPAPSVISIPLALKAATVHQNSPASYSLGIMRLHPLTADLENVASSSSVSSPPRAPFRSGLMPYDQEDAADADAGDVLTACAQPAFRVMVHASIDRTALDASQGELDPTRRHRCPQCGKGFNRPSSLVTHVNMHTGAKPYPCLFEGCPRHFNVKSNMRRHYQRHLRPRPPSRVRAPSSTSSALASPASGSRSPSPPPLPRRTHPEISPVHAVRLPDSSPYHP